MMFVTVGAQLPFDRLIQTVDAWAEANQFTDIFAQIGKSDYTPRWLQTAAFLSPAEFQDKFQSAELVIGHAGMGTIISAMEYKKPLLIMPRDASLGEHRNAHQMSTARRFPSGRGIYVVYNEKELIKQLDVLVQDKNKKIPVAGTVSPELISVIRNFIEGK